MQCVCESSSLRCIDLANGCSYRTIEFRVDKNITYRKHFHVGASHLVACASLSLSLTHTLSLSFPFTSVVRWFCILQDTVVFIVSLPNHILAGPCLHITVTL